MVGAYLVFLSLFGAERLVELWLSHRNTRLAFQRGAIEVGAGHFRAMAVLHASFLPACAAEVVLLRRPFPGAIGCAAFALALCGQALRWWSIRSLAARWNVRVLLVPGEEPVRRGPYRLIRHPNYLAVAIEMACVPLTHGAWITALVFSGLNAFILRERIRVEEEAFGDAYRHAFAGVPRFLPHG